MLNLLLFLVEHFGHDKSLRNIFVVWVQVLQPLKNLHRTGPLRLNVSQTHFDELNERVIPAEGPMKKIEVRFPAFDFGTGCGLLVFLRVEVGGKNILGKNLSEGEQTEMTEGEDVQFVTVVRVRFESLWRHVEQCAWYTCQRCTGFFSDSRVSQVSDLCFHAPLVHEDVFGSKVAMDDLRLAGVYKDEGRCDVSEQRLFHSHRKVWVGKEEVVQAICQKLHHKDRDIEALQKANAHELDNVRVSEIRHHLALLEEVEYDVFSSLVVFAGEGPVDRFPRTESRSRNA